MNILLVGGGGREHAIAVALRRNPAARLFTVMGTDSPGIAALSEEWCRHAETDVAWIVRWAADKAIDFAIVGFEDPLAEGLCDALEGSGVRAFGPSKAAAQLETSKLFARKLLQRHGVPGQIEFGVFHDRQSVERFLRATEKRYAIKPLGLSAGKGVKVMGDQLDTIDDAVAYAAEVIEKSLVDRAVLLEERIEGEEFTLQCFVDGRSIRPMPAVQDYKRAYEGNLGPNTGSMGSYSQADGLLPFLRQGHYDQALRTIEGAVQALRAEGIVYKGVLYGQFMLTADGPKLIEFNARFGDPEAMNVLAVLETDFVEVCEAVIEGRLDELDIKFKRQATVCKYIVPAGYPDNPKVGAPLRISAEPHRRDGIHFYIAKVSRLGDSLATTSSRAIAVLGVAGSISEADELVEEGLRCIEGEYYVRHDIGRVSPSSELLDHSSAISIGWNGLTR